MRKPALVYSLAIHVGILALLFLAGMATAHLTHTTLNVPLHLILSAPKVKAMPAVKGGGGASGAPLPARRERPPQLAAVRAFIVPALNRPETQASLILPDFGPADAPIGLSRGLADTGIRGIGGIIGIGPPTPGGTGGPGGPGDGPGHGGGGSTPGPPPPRITRQPEVLHKEEPEYSDEARKAKWQGTVTLQIEIGVDGRPHDIHVVRGLGLGLDDEAIRAVTNWTFRPAFAGDKPIAAPALIDVAFHLL